MVVGVEGALILKSQPTYLLGSEEDAYWKSMSSYPKYLKYTTNQGGRHNIFWKYGGGAPLSLQNIIT